MTPDPLARTSRGMTVQHHRIILTGIVVILVGLTVLPPLRLRISEVQMHLPRPEVSGRAKLEGASPSPEVGRSNTDVPVGLIGLVNKTDPKAATFSKHSQ